MGVKTKIEQAGTAILKLKPLLRNPLIDLNTPEKFAKCYSWSLLLYGCETWTLKIQTINRIAAFEMWRY